MLLVQIIFYKWILFGKKEAKVLAELLGTNDIKTDYVVPNLISYLNQLHGLWIIQ